MSLVKLLANPEHQKSPRLLVRNIGYCVVFCPFHFAIVFPVLHLFAASDYPIGISKTRPLTFLACYRHLKKVTGFNYFYVPKPPLLLK